MVLICVHSLLGIAVVVTVAVVGKVDVDVKLAVNFDAVVVNGTVEVVVGSLVVESNVV